MLRNIALVAAGLSVVKGQLNAGLLMQYEEELILKGAFAICLIRRFPNALLSFLKGVLLLFKK